MAAAIVEPILLVRNLTVTSAGRRGDLDAVRGVSFDVQLGHTLGIVGESGSGKSITAMTLMRLLPDAARVTGGQVRFDGTGLETLSEQQMRGVRGRRMPTVFQDPMASLNPISRSGTSYESP